MTLLTVALSLLERVYSSEGASKYYFLAVLHIDAVVTDRPDQDFVTNRKIYSFFKLFTDDLQINLVECCENDDRVDFQRLQFLYQFAGNIDFIFFQMLPKCFLLKENNHCVLWF